MTSWPTTPPTEPGWYWVRIGDDFSIKHVHQAPCDMDQVAKGDLYIDSETAVYPFRKNVTDKSWFRHAEWQGPIRPQE